MEEKEMIEKCEEEEKLSRLKREVIIVAPHPDDEIIGNFELLTNPDISPIIIYTEDVPNDRRQESMNLKKFVPNVKVQLFANHIPENLLNPKTPLYFPDFVNEFHPDHVKIGNRGLELFHKGLNVIFYSIQMNTKYIHTVKDFKGKRHLLEKVYPSQKDMWKFDHKYFLFEGRYQFLR